jgi:hypothetical protein
MTWWQGSTSHMGLVAARNSKTYEGILASPGAYLHNLLRRKLVKIFSVTAFVGRDTFHARTNQ